jgi:PAS domain S-box-containing protein
MRPDGWPRIVYISPQVETVTGFSVSEWMNTPNLWESQLHPEDRDRVLASMRSCHSTGESYGIEYRLLTRNHGIVWIRDEAKAVRNEAGQTVSVQGILRDVSKRKAAEEALHRSEDKYRTVFENTGTAAMIIEEDMTLSLVNMEFEKLSGYSKAEVENLKKLLDFVSKDDLQRIVELQQRVTGPSGLTGNCGFRFTDRGGNLKEIHMTVARIPKTSKSVASLMDMTERSRLEKMMMMREKMAALGKVAAGIAHEIRNPLSGINIYLHALDKLSTDRGCTDDEKEIIREIKSASGKIEDVIKRVLNFAKPGQLRLDSIGVNKHIKEAIKLALVILQENIIELETSLEDDLPDCYADPYLLEQVILNLINNAAEAMRDQNGPKRIEVASRKKDDRILISVSDSGPGIPLELRTRIFDPFFTTRKDGSGIGLSICQRIITDHGGSLFLSTSNWGGAQFVMEIPVERRTSLE